MLKYCTCCWPITPKLCFYFIFTLCLSNKPLLNINYSGYFKLITYMFYLRFFGCNGSLADSSLLSKRFRAALTFLFQA